MPTTGKVRIFCKGEEYDVEWTMYFDPLSEENIDYYWSSEFSFEGESWWIGMYPNGRYRNSVGWAFDLYLVRNYPGLPINIEFSFALKTVNGQKGLERRSTENFKGRSFHSIEQFLSRYNFWKSEFLVSESLTVVCTMKRLKSTGSASDRTSAKRSYSKLIEDTENISKYEKKWMERPIKCPGCSDVALLKDLGFNHKCQKEIIEGCIVAAKCFYCKKKIYGQNISMHEKICVDRPIEYPKNADAFLLQKRHAARSEATVTQEKEQLFQDLTDSNDKLSCLNNEINKLLKRTTDLTREKDESVVKFKKSLQESYIKNSQLKDQLLALSQELETERNARKSLKSVVLSMEKKIYELQSTAPDNTQLISLAATLSKEIGDTESAECSYWEMLSHQEKNNTVNCPECLNDVSYQNWYDHKCPISRAEVLGNYGFVSNINRLLEERKGIDVTFVLETSDGETEVVAHQLIVAARSSFFANEFYSKGGNKEHQIIPLKGVNLKAFEEMIRYCYDDKHGWETIEDACALFKVASKFGVVSLVNLCGAFLKHTKIEPGNIFNILEVSEQMEDKSLREECLKVLEEKTEEIIASYELRDVTPNMVHIILDLPKLSLNSEYDLIKWIFEWAKVKYKGEDSFYENARDYLEKLLQDMNFLALTAEEFSMLCENNPDIFSRDEKARISMNIASISLSIPLPGMMEMPDFFDKDLKPREYARVNL